MILILLILCIERIIMWSGFYGYFVVHAGLINFPGFYVLQKNNPNLLLGGDLVKDFFYGQEMLSPNFSLAVLLNKIFSLPALFMTKFSFFFVHISLGLSIAYCMFKLFKSKQCALLAVIFCFLALPMDWNLSNYSYLSHFIPYFHDLAYPLFFIQILFLVNMQIGFGAIILALISIFNPAFFIYNTINFSCFILLILITKQKISWKKEIKFFALSAGIILFIGIFPRLYFLSGIDSKLLLLKSELMELVHMNKLHTFPWQAKDCFYGNLMGFLTWLSLGIFSTIKLKKQISSAYILLIYSWIYAVIISTLFLFLGLFLKDPFILSLYLLKSTTCLNLVLFPIIIYNLYLMITNKDLLTKIIGMLIFSSIAFYIFDTRVISIYCLVLLFLNEYRNFVFKKIIYILIIIYIMLTFISGITDNTILNNLLGIVSTQTRWEYTLQIMLAVFLTITITFSYIRKLFTVCMIFFLFLHSALFAYSYLQPKFMSLYKTQLWAKNNTPEYSIFLGAPDLDGEQWELITERPMIRFSRLILGYHTKNRQYYDFYYNLAKQAGLSKEQAQKDNALSKRFFELTDTELLSIAINLNIDYIVVKKATKKLNNNLTKKVYENDFYAIYQCGLKGFDNKNN
mgnify:CR=1 FL=1